MNTDRLIWAVVALTSVVAGCITALTIWRPGDNTAVITAILGAATPAISVLILLLQVSQKAEEVKKEARFVAAVTAEGLEGARDSARKAKDAHEKTAAAVQNVENTVQEIKGLVNGQKDALLRRIAELEDRLRKRGG